MTFRTDERSMLVEQYMSSLAKAVVGLRDQPIQEAVAMLDKARVNGNTVFVFGNGGSAATATHMACDLSKNTRSKGSLTLRVVSLTDISTLSAFGNDEGYESIFAEPLRALGRRGDVAIAISGSGTSPNVLNAVQVARELRLSTIALTGSSGGKVCELVDVCLRADANALEQIEDIHLVMNHILTVLLRANSNASE